MDTHVATVTTITSTLIPPHPCATYNLPEAICPCITQFYNLPRSIPKLAATLSKTHPVVFLFRSWSDILVFNQQLSNSESVSLLDSLNDRFINNAVKQRIVLTTTYLTGCLTAWLTIYMVIFSNNIFNDIFNVFNKALYMYLPIIDDVLYMYLTDL